MTTEEKIIASIDINGFCKYSSGIAPEQLFNAMNDYYTVAEDLISACEGEMIKGIGDCILAVFKTSGESDFLKTAQFIKTSLERWWHEEIENVQVNIHAHVGTISYGIIKTHNKEWLDIFGKAVNELFLLKGNGIILSDELRNIIDL